MKRNATTKMTKTYMVTSLFLLMEHQPFTAITISDIAKKAGVNRSTYYRHFNSKEEIVYYFVEQVLDEFSKTISTNIDLYHYLLQLFSHLKKYQKEFLLLCQNKLSLFYLTALNKNLDISSHQAYLNAYHIGGIFNCSLLWFSRNMIDTPEKMAQISLEILPDNFVPYLISKKKC
ncbi:TetR/AcrR family transcriptional regulator [uncultured Thomasclavelia sp.]|uniref:TetR/AcrR family transcriptional regulator n=1 Tax=uncultured Thomasclavelia sp. TaxID=3025759 RepID=UPI0025F99457|nr:TetR/AcrR family transcriptional regulator [uncultured Thomasclavelia sp.]